MGGDNAPKPIIRTYSSQYLLIPKRIYTTMLYSKKEYICLPISKP